MIPRLPGPPRDQPPPLALVADDDPALVEALTRALESGHFRVVAAADGEDALRRARTDSPEVVIAGWRLLRRSGLELCDAIRREPEHGELPIVLVTAADDPEQRVEGLAHGADEVVAKALAPRELVARAQRLVMRTRQTARHRSRSAELERDLHRSEQDARRAREEAVEERTLRELSSSMLGELLRSLDPEVLDARLLREACRQTGARSAALLAPDPSGTWGVVAVRGDLPERWDGFTLPAPGTCLEWLVTLARPLKREQLERVAQAHEDMARLATHGVAVLALLATADGAPEAVLACEDRSDGRPMGPRELTRLAVLCGAAASARATSRRFRDQQDRALELLSADEPEQGVAARESLERLLPLAAAMGVSDRERQCLARALECGPCVWEGPGREGLERLASADPTRRLARLGELLDDAAACARGEAGCCDDTLAWLASAGLRYQSLRAAGRSAHESWRTTATWLGAHASPPFREHFPEALESAG